MGAGITVNYQNPTPLFNLGFWKVNTAQHKVTNQTVSLWTIDYDLIQKTEKKADREKFLNICLHSVQQMRRIHHPLVLKIIEISESIKALNFAAEPIQTCLSYEDSFTPDDASFIAYQLAQVMKFVHQNARMVLFGLSPDSICLTSTLDLKLCNFAFASPMINEYGVAVLRTGEWTLSPFCTKLNFTAPEVINGNQTSQQADVFSFGLTIASTYLNHQALDCYSPDEFLRAVTSKAINFGNLPIPSNVKDLILSCISISPNTRPSFDSILQSPIFESFPLKALQYVEIIVTKTDEDRYVFYKGVAKTLSAFSIRILQSRFLPLFISDVLREQKFGPVLIPQIFEIGRSLDPYSFMNEILTPLSPLFTNSSNPDCLLAIVSSIPLIIEQLDESQYSTIIFPLIQTAFTSTISALHKEALSHVPLMISKMSNNSIEHELVPQIVELFSTSTDIKIVSTCIKCLSICLPKLNHDLFAEQVSEKITAAWNRLSGPPELAEAALSVVLSLHTAIQTSVKFVIPMVSELIASERVDPPVQLQLCNYMYDIITRFKTGSSKSSLSGLWLNKGKMNSGQQQQNRPAAVKNVMSIDQFEKQSAAPSHSVNFSSLRKVNATDDTDSSQSHSGFGDLDATPRRQSENRGGASMFAGMKTRVQPSDQAKRGSTNSMFSGLKVSGK
ncbi:protein kinase [Tritrichomonas foetus]|uniref:Protein kinase n=1 Tax=Tritrichomonas foetus TaxID=1144522 RepID=A0A1J4KZQ7_9EUKA|nr:protein kinase [Tritrichomonas foetus]|eukprot:OHT15077.1 protein kinase [Tritrichomonas foetus]